MPPTLVPGQLSRIRHRWWETTKLSTQTRMQGGVEAVGSMSGLAQITSTAYETVYSTSASMDVTVFGQWRLTIRWEHGGATQRERRGLDEQEAAMRPSLWTSFSTVSNEETPE